MNLKRKPVLFFLGCIIVALAVLLTARQQQAPKIPQQIEGDIKYFQESEYVTKKVLAEATSDYKITYEYPQLQNLPNKAVQETLNASFIPNAAEIKTSLLETRTEEAGELQQAFNNSTYDISYLTPERLSVKFTQSNYLGWEAHEHQNASTAVYDLATGQQLALSDIIEPVHLDRVVTLVSDKLNKGGYGFPNTHHPKALALEELDKFLLTDEGIVFVFDPYEVASFADGFIEVLVPNNEVQNILTPSGPARGIFFKW